MREEIDSNVQAARAILSSSPLEKNTGWTPAQIGLFVHNVSTASVSDNPIITTTVP